MGEILWQPDPERIRRSRMYRFLNWVNESFSRDFSIYAELHRWSVTELEQFWEFYRAGSGIHFHRGPDRVLSSHSMPGARWFEGAELNYAENLLTGDPDRTAILSKVENRPLTTLTYRELAHRARQFAAALEKLGIRAGDRVAGYLPNISETVIAMLGTAGIGAVWTSCSPDFGPQGVCDRLGQVDPALLVCTDGYFYNGKTFSVTDSVKTLATRLPGLKHVVVVPFLEEGSPAGGLDNLPVTLWPEFLNSRSRENFQFQPFPFNHPLFILYSSGTTGLPKGIVHGAGGTLLQHHKEHALHTDIGSEDVVFFYTTCGWMMWNWLVSALAQKAAIVLYEGSPSYPNLNVLWDLIDETGITMFGTSPKFLSQNIKMGIQPSRHSRFPTLRTVLSTGAPLDAQCFRWVYKNVKEDLQLSSISGGTDIISCFMLGNPMLPVQCEEIQSLGLGMDVAALDENGRSV
ncbi:MAG: acetoacetate--CoA ligase, partial [Nitrospinaceae bacterium]|nr:acetoacetate--CoA ligase [Nitrospinaceae bacterium]NIR53479.1 acetoacetate--CoA ligase [Nitrospinaceae bacterium]NIS83877.1 acetoacetate--CoA ligase [Nitrospinaceae bacterium]NIT80676.1 acetoacetate--CoA ligase [Nitrospinaceae bacterium]NIU42996.1 acetoacetate--CoA ligase [Nitrospinaceae bacterium]